jgi:hypothetical protein
VYQQKASGRQGQLLSAPAFRRLLREKYLKTAKAILENKTAYK